MYKKLGDFMLNEVILKRKSIKQFDGQEIENDEILSLFEAARRAPSAFNEQPWRFLLASRSDIKNFNAVLNILVEKNREWARDSSLLVIVLSKRTLTRNNKPNRHFLYDTASAVANLTFQANSLDLYVHQMGGFDSDKVMKDFSVPDDFEPAVVLAIGRKEKYSSTKEESQLEINRTPISHNLFENKFGVAHSILKNEIILIEQEA
jgi:nitroreductase